MIISGLTERRRLNGYARADVGCSPDPRLASSVGADPLRGLPAARFQAGNQLEFAFSMNSAGRTRNNRIAHQLTSDCRRSATTSSDGSPRGCAIEVTLSDVQRVIGQLSLQIGCELVVTLSGGLRCKLRHQDLQ
jgi:hypothetical protein